MDAETLACNLKKMRGSKQHCIQVDLEVEFCVKFEGDTHFETKDCEETRAKFGGNCLDELMRAHCIRQGLLVHAPGSDAELLEESVIQFAQHLEPMLSGSRCWVGFCWAFLYYLKLIDRFGGDRDVNAMKVVERALGVAMDQWAEKAEEYYNDYEEARFIAQFEKLAKKMIETHYGADGAGRKRDRAAFEQDAIEG